MDLVLRAPDLSDTEIRYINYCRLFLQLLTVSDACDANGTHIADGISNGALPDLRSLSLLEEPYQERPGPLAWTAWRKFLKNIRDSSGRLYCPLGPWRFPAHRLRRRWPFLFSPSTGQTFS